MLRVDRLTLPVAEWKQSRDWYVERLGTTVEFEIRATRYEIPSDEIRDPSDEIRAIEITERRTAAQRLVVRRARMKRR
jgi:hypothetical protein